jgi:Xaa-Pro aminopeptidase
MTSLPTEPRTGIPAAELEARRERLLGQARAQGLSGYVLFDEHYIRYASGLWFLSTERPVIFAQALDGTMVVFVPEFEVERVRAETDFANVESYPEYPGLVHPMTILARVLDGMGIGGAIGADQDGYPGILGYRGPALSEVTGASVTPLGDELEAMLVRKSDTELAFIRESARWCEHAHRLLQQYSVPGATEAEAALRAGHEATLALLAEHDGEVGGVLSSSDGVQAGYRGQIGTRSSWAHAIAHNIAFKPGDLLVTETSAPI